MNRETRSCRFCKTQASINVRFCKKCGKSLKLGTETGSMAQPGFYKENTVQNTLMSCPSISHSDDPPRTLPPSPETVSAPSSSTLGTATSKTLGATTSSSRCPRPTPTGYPTALLITPVDAFDTMILMGLTAEAAEAKDLILSQLDFDLDMEVQHFAVAIRIPGGLISAQQLDGDPCFLELAIDLANRMLPVFDSNTGHALSLRQPQNSQDPLALHEPRRDWHLCP